MPLDVLASWPPEPQLHEPRVKEPELATLPGGMLPAPADDQPRDPLRAELHAAIAQLAIPVPPIPTPGVQDVGGYTPWTYWTDGWGNHASFNGLLTLPNMQQQPATYPQPGTHLSNDVWLDAKTPGDVTSFSRLYLGGPNYGVWFGGQDGGNPWNLGGLNLASFWNVGVVNQNAAGQKMPMGYQGIQFDARQGIIRASGPPYFRAAGQNDVYQFGFMRFYRSGAQEIRMDCTGNTYYVSITDAGGAPGAGASGGTGYKVNDRLTDIWANTYTVLAVDGSGAVTQLRIDQNTIWVAALTNPVALIACQGCTGTGASVNLTQTAMNLMTIWSPGDLQLRGSAGDIVRSHYILRAGDSTTYNALTITPGATPSAPISVNQSGTATNISFNTGLVTTTYMQGNASVAAGVSGSNNAITMTPGAAAGSTANIVASGSGPLQIQASGGVNFPNNVTSTGGTGYTIGTNGPTLRAGTGAATGTQPAGSLFLRTDGAVGSRLYVSAGGGTWAAVAGV